MTASPTVFIIDDDPAVCRSTAMMLQAHGLESRAFATADEFLRAVDPAASTTPGCILLDLRMPGMTGEELLRHLRQGGVHIPVIVITGHGDVPAAVRSMKLGVVDFLQKPVDHAILVDTVKQALRHDADQRRQDAARRDEIERINRLTPRERELIALLARGRTSKEIAAALEVSVKTVDNHRAHLLSKLGAANVAELAAIAVRAGLG
ncbi:MAG TPA: response regulator [Tepidisphaeraceae bacterium]|jgi:FixJ family two-component response regulator